MSAQNSENNPLICDIETGICGPMDSPISANDHTKLVDKTAIQVLYVTDPICSACWGIEPQLRKLKLAYGHSFEMTYRMGGLLPDWSYNSGGISSPADVAHHWDEVSQHYDMPIDGDIWLEDPLESSYPPSIAFKAAQIQDADKAISLMRVLREKLFLEKRNICRWEYVEETAQQVGLDPQKLKVDFNQKAPQRFQEDLKVVREMGVRGFPTLFFKNQAGQSEFVYGARPFKVYELILRKLNPEIQAKPYSKDWKSLFELFPTLTAKEFSVLAELSKTDSLALLNQLTEKGEITTFTTKNGNIWKRK